MSEIRDLRHLADELVKRRGDWKHHEVMNALCKLRDKPLQHISDAAWIVAETRPDAGPAIIALDGPHWQKGMFTPKADSRDCVVCGRPEHLCREMNLKVHPDERHDYRDRINPRTPQREKRATRLAPYAGDERPMRQHTPSEPSEAPRTRDDASRGSLPTPTTERPQEAK